MDSITLCLNGYEYKRTEECIVFYWVIFNENTSFPPVCEATKINADLTIQLKCGGSTELLPKWMIQGYNGKLTLISMLQNLPNFIACAREKLPQSVVNELKEREMYLPKRCPPYSAAIIRYALLLRYTSLQAYKL